MSSEVRFQVKREKSKRMSYENIESSHRMLFAKLKDRENIKLVGARVKPRALLLKI